MRSRDRVSARRRRCIGVGFEKLESRLPLAGDFPAVPNLLGQLAQMQTHADAFAFTLPSNSGAPDASVLNHYQGILRYPGTGTPTFYVSQKHESGGYIHVVTMGTRGTDGERLNSNLQVIGRDTEDTLPPADDRWLRTIRLNGLMNIDGRPVRGYVHPGGMAIADNILFVAMDTPTNTAPHLTGGVSGSIMLFDLGSEGALRANPLPIQIIPVSHMIDNLAVIKNGDHYLIYTNGDGGKQVHFYATNHTNLRADDLRVIHKQRLNVSLPTHYLGPQWPQDSRAHQSAFFVRQSTSTTPSAQDPLFLIATRLSGVVGNTFVGDDLANVYRVSQADNVFKLDYHATYHPTLRYSQAGTLGNFAAAGNAYISPSGELLFYATPHNDVDTFVVVNGVKRFDLVEDNVRIAELGHRDGVRSGSAALRPRIDASDLYEVSEGGTVALQATVWSSAGPWVELFDDDGFGDRSIKIPFQDRARFELNNFENLDDFGDKATSVRWRLPVGMSVELFEHDSFGGAKRVLVGNGRVQAISDLGSFGDKTSSLRFVGSNPASSTSVQWDLDGDGVFGEIGSAARNGNERGARVTFLTGDLDGPTSRTVSVRVVDGTGATTTDSTTIRIYNSPPVAQIVGPDSANSNVPLQFTISATDSSLLDRFRKFTFVVDFGDGKIVTYSPSAKFTEATRTITHTYARNGLYVIRVRAIDKDGDVSNEAVLEVAVGPVVNG